MGNVSSGCYIIDDDYIVVGVNETAKKLYPQLEIGKKCHKCLMNLDTPCGPCPVANGVKGPKTYMDPIRNIAEIVDAVEIPTEEHGIYHGLIFHTVGTDASFAATLPKSAIELKDFALIRALSVDYYDVFSVHLNTGDTELYRYNGGFVSATDINKNVFYEEATEKYISKYVFQEDQDMVREQTSISYMKKVLMENEFFTIHFRVWYQDEIHYFYRKIGRIGDKDNFEYAVVGVGNEDEEIKKRSDFLKMEKNLTEMELDSHTGLYTKEAFYIYGEEHLRKYHDISFDFCIAKLHNISEINHQYGKKTGDNILALIGRLLREYDDEYTILGYMGDGVFVSLTVNTSTQIRKNNIKAFRDRIIKESDVKILSLKWSLYTDVQKDITVEEIYHKSQYALSTIRADVNSDYVEFDHSILEKMEEEKLIESCFEDALKNGEFIAWYQPKYSVITKEICGAEALVRWKKPDGQIISPTRFISVLEKCGKINRLDPYIFQEVCRIQKKLMETGLNPVPISVNLSRASLFTEDIAEHFGSIAREYEIPAKLIPIEITESAAVRAKAIRTFADDIISQGFILYMDDFGSGYSSLASLNQIPFECIKLDKSLIDCIGEPGAESLLKHTIAHAKETKKTVVAEGVETYEQYIFLKIAGCDYIQGYYFSKPISEEEFIKLLEE